MTDTLVQILNSYGFNAYSAYSGSQAIRHATRTSFDVLLADVVMGEMTGIVTAIEISKVLPNIKVLLMSGNPETAPMLENAHAHGHEFEVLAKPFHPSVIIDRLKTIRNGD